MRIITRLGDLGEKFLDNFCTILLFIALLLGLEQIFSRYFFGITQNWAEELFIYITLYAIYMIMGLATRYNEHIKIDFLVRNRSGSFKKILDWFTEGLGLATSIFLVFISIKVVLFSYGMGEVSYSDLPYPVWAVKLSFPIGFVFLSFYYLERVCRLFFPKSEEMPEEK